MAAFRFCFLCVCAPVLHNTIYFYQLRYGSAIKKQRKMILTKVTSVGVFT